MKSQLKYNYNFNLFFQRKNLTNLLCWPRLIIFYIFLLHAPNNFFALLVLGKFVFINYFKNPSLLNKIRLVIMMLSLIATLIWSSLWINYGIKTTFTGIYAVFYFIVPGSVTLGFVGKYYILSLKMIRT